MKKILKINKQGLTLVELLISMALASVIFMIVGSMLAMFVTQNTKSQRQEIFEQTKNDLTQELSNNVRWGKEISLGSDYLIVDGNEYRVENGYFQKNGENFSSDKLEITHFEVFDRSTTVELVGAEVMIEMRDRNYPLASDVVRIVVSQRVTEIDL